MNYSSNSYLPSPPNAPSVHHNNDNKSNIKQRIPPVSSLTSSSSSLSKTNKKDNNYKANNSNIIARNNSNSGTNIQQRTNSPGGSPPRSTYRFASSSPRQNANNNNNRGGGDGCGKRYWGFPVVCGCIKSHADESRHIRRGGDNGAAVTETTRNVATLPHYPLGGGGGVGKNEYGHNNIHSSREHQILSYNDNSIITQVNNSNPITSVCNASFVPLHHHGVGGGETHGSLLHHQDSTFPIYPHIPVMTASLNRKNRLIPPPSDPRVGPYLPPQLGVHVGRKTLVLDLDETLVHSSFRPVPIATFIIPVEIEGHIHDVYVCKRPGVDEFLVEMAQLYEVVIFTASLAKYADPLMDNLDPDALCTWRLFRESCTLSNGSYVKDLSKLGRDLRHVIIIDNSPNSYSFQQDNAIPIKSWFDDMNDRELKDLIPILEALSKVADIPAVMRQTLAADSDDEDEDEDEDEDDEESENKNGYLNASVPNPSISFQAPHYAHSLEYHTTIYKQNI